MKDFETYIFDLDGTLLNTLDDLAGSCNYALREMQMPERSVEEVRQFVGNGVRKLIERAVPAETTPEKVELTLQKFRQHYVQHSMDNTKPYDGIIEMLEELQRRGKHLAVVSNKFYDATVKLCRHYFPGTVSVAIGERENIRKKPAPDTVVEALRQLGVEKSGAVYVGDSDVDILTARNVGIPCISVLWGFRDEDFLKANGATCLVSRPSEILAE